MSEPYVWWEGQWNVWIPGDSCYRANMAWWWALGHNLAQAGCGAWLTLAGEKKGWDAAQRVNQYVKET